MSAPLSAIVLAAGLGTRMGMAKARLLLDGESLLRRHVVRFLEAGCGRVTVVVRSIDEQAVYELLTDLPSRVLVGDTASQAHSLALAVNSHEHEEGAVFVTPVDLRPAALTTLHDLSIALDDDFDAVTPQHGGVGGHPALIRAAELRTITRVLRPLCDLLHDLGARRRRLAVDDATVAEDFDAPSDLSR